MSPEFVLALAGIVLWSVASLISVVRLIGPVRSKGGTIITALGTLCIVLALAFRGVNQGRIPAFGRFETLSVYAAMLSVAYLYSASRYDTRGISAIILPYVVAVAALAMPGLAVSPQIDPELGSIWLTLHIVTAFAGYAVFTLASILAGAYLVQDWNLKRKHFGALFQRLPSLETLDQLMYSQVSAAFVTFSVSILLGVLLTYLVGWGTKWMTDPKVVATGATWALYAILFHLRARADRHGRRIALVTLLGLICILFTFLGVHFVADSVHDFAISSGR